MAEARSPAIGLSNHGEHGGGNVDADQQDFGLSLRKAWAKPIALTQVMIIDTLA